jgi:SAM-dependent methyltransferase
MSANLPFVPDRFQSTIPYYTAHRLHYPEALISEVTRRIGLTKRDRVLDLGCGPGYPAIQLARSGAGEVIGMDPDPAMLAAAREEAERAKVDVRFVQGSSHDLSPTMGAFKLVTMGRSFHWMDRVSTLRALERIVEPTGAVVILSETPEPAPENRWKRVLKDLQREFGGAALRGGPEHHASVLLASAFSQLECYGIIKRLPLTVDAIVGRAFSLYRSSPAALGDQMGQFEAELRFRLLELSPSGEFSEVIQFGALIAHRPTA